MSLFNYFKCCCSSKENKKQEITIDNSNFKTTDANSKITASLSTSLMSSPKVQKVKNGKRASLPNRGSFSFQDSAIIAPTVYFRKSICDCPSFLPEKDTEKISTQIVGSQKLEMIDVKGDLLYNEKVEINYNGIKSKGQGNKDIDFKINTGLLKAINYFWFKDQNGKNENCKKDFILNHTINKQLNDYAFLICYIKEQNAYKLKFNEELSEEDKIFINVSNKHPLSIIQNIFIFFNSVKFCISSLSNCLLEVFCITTNQKVVYNCITQSEITIGKSEQCSFSFANDKTMSDIQVTISFDTTQKIWKIRDGCENKPSDNGTLIFSTNPILIDNDTHIKINDKEIKLLCL